MSLMEHKLTESNHLICLNLYKGQGYVEYIISLMRIKLLTLSNVTFLVIAVKHRN